ncbi:MAG: LamG-like jellyroll fold domain-containing protein [Planctomycetota bacterium]
MGRYDVSTLQLYHDGQSVGTSGGGILLDPSRPFLIGARSDAGSAGGFFNGSIDEVGFFSAVLTPEDIEMIMNNGLARITIQPLARRPDPKDGAIYENTWVTLTWNAGDFTVSHDVYLGDNFDEVNDGTHDSETFRGNYGLDTLYFAAGFAGNPYPDGLVPGTTYYWRIDEVNDANAASPWKGNIWSFMVSSKKAYEPYPADGAMYLIPADIELSWTGGLGSVLHYVFIGESFEEVDAATEGILSAFLNYTPSGLESGKTYFWRVDEFDGTTTHRGDIWSFKTMPDVPIYDPNLVGWWKLDEGSGVMALDGSGYGNHGALIRDPQWVTGHDGDALQFDGSGTYVDCGNAEVLNDEVFSASFWCNIPSTQSWNHMVSRGSHGASGVPGSVNWGVMMYSNEQRILFETFNDTSWVGISADTTVAEWHHIVATYDGDKMQLYHDGELIAETTGAGILLDQSRSFLIGARSDNGTAGGFFNGSIDDVRIYNKVLTQDEVLQAMQGDPTLAWGPRPINKSTPDIYNSTSISWSPGAKAAEHDVYFGTDKDAVDDADTTTADIYRGRQAATEYTLPESLEWGSGPYYWRIDEYNSDETVSKGSVWTFSVADFLLIDDFEDYDGDENQIWFSWLDGLGYGTPGTADYYPGNGTGSAVGDENTISYMEETIVNSGLKSMPLSYDNNKQGYAKYSEIEFTLSALRDWTQQDVAELSLWFRGYPAVTGSFAEAPVGTYTMTATGEDIWNAADEFHFAFKMLSGAGSIVTKVLSVDNTDPWAKAGVMIRETLDPDSKFAAVYITPGNGCRFQARINTAVDATSDTSVASTEQMAITAPYWIKLERDIGGNYRGFYSADGLSWTPMTWNPQYITMGANVYVGLALTSHDNAQKGQAVFSNVTTTGSVTGQWTNQDIGILSNDPEPLYIAVSNSSGTSAVVVHDDPAAATIDTWTEWIIPLQAFADRGIVLTDVDRIAIGLGTRNNVTVPGGSGKMFFDDFRLYRSREAAE